MPLRLGHRRARLRGRLRAAPRRQARDRRRRRRGGEGDPRRTSAPAATRRWIELTPPRFDRLDLTAAAMGRVSPAEIDAAGGPVLPGDAAGARTLPQNASRPLFTGACWPQGSRLRRRRRAVRLGARWRPIAGGSASMCRGGLAAYPSSVLMNAVPAAVGGRRARGSWWCRRRTASFNPLVLAAGEAGRRRRDLSHRRRPRRLAALAYGTATIPRRRPRSVGPGNAYVAEAKRQVFGNRGHRP